MVNLNVIFNHNYPRRKQLQKVSEDSRRQTTEAETKGLPSGAGQPMGPLVSVGTYYILTCFSSHLLITDTSSITKLGYHSSDGARNVCWY
jgi:hypothetical protein